MNGFADFPSLATRFLFDDAGLLDELDEGLGGTVTDGRFVGIHSNNNLVSRVEPGLCFFDEIIHPNLAQVRSNVLLKEERSVLVPDRVRVVATFHRAIGTENS